MLRVVEQHVGERVPHLTRGLEHARVVARREDAAAATPHEIAVHATRESNGEALHATRQSRAIIRLDDHVKVIALDRVLRDAELIPVLLFPKSVLDAPEAALTAQIGNLARHAHGDVERMLGTVEHGPRAMRYGPRDARATGAMGLQRKLELNRTTRHDLWHILIIQRRASTPEADTDAADSD